MKNSIIYPLFLFASFFAACNSDDETPTGSGIDYEGYTLLWSDEFDSDISSSNWNFEIGNGTDYGLPPGWGNNEKQLYTDSQNNANIQPDGEGASVLAITARLESNGRYTSSKLTTQGKQSFRFGRIEARIKVPEGRGLWPAFWLLGENITEVDWPGCGEIDIMEVIGHAPEVVHSSAHYTNSENKVESNTKSLTATENLSDDYHIYRLDWTPTEMIYSLDGIEVNQVAIEEDMKEFLRPHYLIFNVAVGGNWPGDPDQTTSFPQRMLIDWVRVYSKDGLNAPAIPPLDIDEETLGQLSNDLALFAFNGSLSQFIGISLKAFGGGGEPDITTSDIAVDGDSSLMLSYPGGSWGGAFFELDPTIDASQYASGTLVFSLHKPAELSDIEIKLESVATAASLFLKDYSGVDVGNGFLEYRIPISDFTGSGLDLKDLKIPFALWNPVDASGEYLVGVILLDNIYIE